MVIFMISPSASDVRDGRPSRVREELSAEFFEGNDIAMDQPTLDISAD